MMRSRFAAATSLRLLLIALAVSGTSAKYCDFWLPNAYGGNAVSSQEELETLYAGCTEIDGNVNIAANYTGEFYFPNVTYIYGVFRTAYVTNSDGDEEPVPSPLLTSIVAPDLNNTYSIHIDGAPALTTISFPRLTVMNGGIKLVGIEDCAIDFPVLKTSGNLIVTGNSTSFNFPKLANVKFLRISRNASSEKDYDYDRDYRTVEPANQVPLDINFPALQTATQVYLQGNISSLSLPKLFQVGDGPQYYGRYFKLLTYGNPLNISLPSLYDLKDISLSGTIGSFSFPVLKDIERFEVNATIPLNVTLEPIRTISQRLDLAGNITAVSMTSLTDLDSVEIDSDYSGFYCSSIASEFERITGHKFEDYECKGRVKSKLPLILGLSIGLGVPLILAFVGYGCWRRRTTKKRQEAKTNKPPGFKLGVPPIYSTDGPPTYVSEGSEQGGAGVAGAGTGEGNGARREGEGVDGAGDVARARPGDGRGAQQEGAYGRRDVYR